jgi:hypothetical protein
MSVAQLFQIAILQFDAKVLRLSGVQHWVDALPTSIDKHRPVCFVGHSVFDWLNCGAIIVVHFIASFLVIVVSISKLHLGTKH